MINFEYAGIDESYVENNNLKIFEFSGFIICKV